MESRVKIATIGSVVASAIAVIALAMAPVGATTNGFWMGGGSDDEFEAKSYVKTDIDNMNHADVSTNTNQTAMTGSVDVSHNDDLGGGAGTGNAANKSGSSTTLAASNTHASAAPAVAMPSVSPAEFEDFDQVTLKSTVKTYVDNTNQVAVSTNTNQTAMSGSIEVHCNDDSEGDLTTGNASNESTSSTVINLSN